TLDDQLAVSVKGVGAEGDHPLSGGKAERNVQGVAKGSGVLDLRERVGGRDVNGTGDVMVHQKLHRADEVEFVDPRHELSAVAKLPAQADAREASKDVEGAVPIGT